MKWRYGVETPEELYGGKMVLTNQNEPLIVIGASGLYVDRLYKFSSGKWTQLNITLKTGRSRAFVQVSVRWKVSINFTESCFTIVSFAATRYLKRVYYVRNMLSV